MGARGKLDEEGAPAQVLQWLAAHPDSTIDAAIDGLNLKPSAGYYALARLHDLGQILRVDGERPARWRVKGQSAPVESAVRRCDVAPTSQRGDYTVLLFPTGTLWASAGAVQRFSGEGQDVLKLRR